MTLAGQMHTDLQKRQRIVLAVFAVFLMLFFLFPPLMPERWNALYLSYGRAAIVAVAAIYFFFHGFRGPIEVKLVLYYSVWVLLTRLLNTDYYLQNELDLVIARILCCVILPLGLLLQPRERLVLLDVVIAVAGAFYFLIALLGLYACIFGIYFYIPPEDVVFGFDSAYWCPGFYYIVAEGTNRTISAVWFYLSWCMMVYEFFRCGRKLWRIPILLAMFVFHLAIAFCFCRSIKLAFCINIAMLTFLLGQRYVKVQSRGLKALVSVVLMLAVLPITYRSFDVLTDTAALVYNSLDTEIERTSDQFLWDSTVEAHKDGQTFSDVRELSVSVSSLSGRRKVFSSVIPSLRYEPRRILIGKYSHKVMEAPNFFLHDSFYHMHNIWLQVLMLTGLPGFLLIVGFTLLLIWRMLRLFFSKVPGATLAIKSLTFPLTGVLIYGMFETMLFTQCADDRACTDFRELFFFLAAGIVLAFSYEFAPPGKRSKES